MNYQSFGKELTLISKKYLEFFNYNNDCMFEYNLVKGFNNECKKIFLDHRFPTLDYQSLGKVFELPEVLDEIKI